LEQFKEDNWDRQISADAAAGKLDFLAKEACGCASGDPERDSGQAARATST